MTSLTSRNESSPARISRNRSSGEPYIALAYRIDLLRRRSAAVPLDSGCRFQESPGLAQPAQIPSADPGSHCLELPNCLGAKIPFTTAVAYGGRDPVPHNISLCRNELLHLLLSQVRAPAVKAVGQLPS